MTSGGQGRSGTPYDLSNRFHSQGLAAGGSALLDAINRGKVHLAKFILDAGEQDIINTRDFKGKTPLIRACYIKEEKTRAKAIDLLLSKGADVNIQDDQGRTALSYACELRCNDIVRVLFKNNVDPDIADNEGNTPLIYSAMVGNDIGVEILIRSFRRLGLNVDHVNNEGLTALLIAAKNGFIECASILALEGKACISFRDREKGLNAEEWARSQGCLTPEVMPFSAQAAFMNYRPLRADGYMEGDEAGAAGGAPVSPGGSEAGRKISNASRSLYSITPPGAAKAGGGSSKTTKDLDMDELNKKLHQLHSVGDKAKTSHTLQVIEPYSNRARDKRRSLPSIRFFGMPWGHNEPTERHHHTNKEGGAGEMTLPGISNKTSGSGGSPALTPEGAKKHLHGGRRKSGSKARGAVGQLTNGTSDTSLSGSEQWSLSPRSPCSPTMKTPQSTITTTTTIVDVDVPSQGSMPSIKVTERENIVRAHSPTLTSASAIQVTIEGGVSPECEINK